ncbi:hypothetical protein RU95_GL002307 [Enterococcus avium]|nr:hypothetical protein RU95_GL002307 [Enterococcus avium]
MRLPNHSRSVLDVSTTTRIEENNYVMKRVHTASAEAAL